MRRNRNAKIVATLGPASSTREQIEALFRSGADVFRFNFSHGDADEHRERMRIVREIERDLGRPIGVLVDLQGPKLRIGRFASGPIELAPGAEFRLDLDQERAGDVHRVALPHTEIFAAIAPDTDLLLDDGRVRLRVIRVGPDYADTLVIAGGPLSDRKGVNVPGAILPLSALTAKDRHDLALGLELGADWIALSFVQRPEDVVELKQLVQGRAGVVAKIEKPAAIQSLDAIIAQADAVMVARGDLGVEMPAEQVPVIQKRITRACRHAGKPVIVATQMLDSMVSSPVPTRAEASDVATAVYDGADAVMLSAESASGAYPVQAVGMMDRIIRYTETDPHYRASIETSRTTATADIADAICSGVRYIAGLLGAGAVVAYTCSGFTAVRMARERPDAPIIGMTPLMPTARRLTLAWGVHPVVSQEVVSVTEMTNFATQTALEEGFAQRGDAVVISAGLPFASSGTTNLLRVAKVP